MTPTVFLVEVPLRANAAGHYIFKCFCQHQGLIITGTAVELLARDNIRRRMSESDITLLRAFAQENPS